MSASVPSIDVRMLEARLRTGIPPLLLDVREPHEIEICALENIVSMPLATVPQSAAALPRDRDIVVICHHGGRSLKAALYLQSQGFDKVINLSGGMHAWATDIDKDMATY